MRQLIAREAPVLEFVVVVHIYCLFLVAQHDNSSAREAPVLELSLLLCDTTRFSVLSVPGVFYIKGMSPTGRHPCEPDRYAIGLGLLVSVFERLRGSLSNRAQASC